MKFIQNHAIVLQRGSLVLQNFCTFNLNLEIEILLNSKTPRPENPISKRRGAVSDFVNKSKIETSPKSEGLLFVSADFEDPPLRQAWPSPQNVIENTYIESLNTEAVTGGVW